MRIEVWDVEGAWPRGRTHWSQTFKQLSQPESIPDDVVAEVKQIGWPR